MASPCRAQDAVKYASAELAAIRPSAQSGRAHVSKTARAPRRLSTAASSLTDSAFFEMILLLFELRQVAALIQNILSQQLRFLCAYTFSVVFYFSPVIVLATGNSVSKTKIDNRLTLSGK